MVVPLMPRLDFCSLCLWLTVRALDFNLHPQPMDQSERVHLLLTQYQVTMTQHQGAAVPSDLSLSPSPNLARIFYPSFDHWVLFCHQTPTLFSTIFSGEAVPEFWSQDKGFSVYFCLCLLKALTFSTL